MKFSISSRK